MRHFATQPSVNRKLMRLWRFEYRDAMAYDITALKLFLQVVDRAASPRERAHASPAAGRWALSIAATTHQRVLHPAQQKTISGDIQSRCRLPCHTSPASQPNACRKRPIPTFSATSPAAAPLDRGRGASRTSTHADRRCAQTSCFPTCSIRRRTFRPAADTDHAPPRRRARPGP
jgi:hypothetical protein